MKPLMIKKAQLEWSDKTPISTEFQDVYFSTDDGAEESRYVFLEGNNLEQRWKIQSPDHFSIAETGFGTGLNFLCSWDLWLKNSEAHQHLHFLSVERFPLDKDSLVQALSVWPQFKPLIQVLIDNYPGLINGWHSLHLPNPLETGGQVVLHLFLGDVLDWLPQIDGEIDAWFLDGFTPSKNPNMWSEQLFLQIARLTPFNGTVATFTAASKIQNSLKACGFKVSKRKGYGKKREMVMASQQYTNGPQPPNWLCDKPWLLNSYKGSSIDRNKNKTATIIGAGIAGCSTAFSLAKRGWKVTILDKKTIASGASGNAQGVLYAKLSAEMNLHSQFYLSGYLFSLNNLKHQLSNKENWNNCGVLQLATNEKEEKRQHSFCNKYQLDDVVIGVDKLQASKLAGIHIPYSGLFFKDGAWVYPNAWCSKLLDHKNITLLENTQAEKLTRINNDSKNNNWLVSTNIANHSENSSISSGVLIICNANDAKLLDHLSFLPTKPVAGQVTQLTSQTINLNTVLCGDHYVTPSHNGQLNFGASYRIKSDSTEILVSDDEANIKNLELAFPSVSEQLDLSVKPKGRASVRCTSPDYTPIAGPICDENFFMNNFFELKKNRKWKFQKQAEFIDGLYINIAHGSRGLTSAPLCAELIVAHITGEPLPMPKAQADLLNPNRFLVNKIIKNK
jgi:tRNA 5-methylaminomethyl-2-thiouridine biosynthesis bifunctional protein